MAGDLWELLSDGFTSRLPCSMGAVDVLSPMWVPPVDQLMVRGSARDGLYWHCLVVGFPGAAECCNYIAMHLKAGIN